MQIAVDKTEQKGAIPHPTPDRTPELTAKDQSYVVDKVGEYLGWANPPEIGKPDRVVGW